MKQEKITQNIKKSWEKYENNELCISGVDFPITIMIEVTNQCNLACTMCMNPKMSRKRGFMSIKLLRKILQEASQNGVKNVALYTTGEPLLHPKIFEFIRICKEYDFYTYITTNANALNKSRVEELLNSKIDSIKYSIDGLNKDEYEKIRVGGRYEKVIENMQYIKKIRDDISSNTKLSMGVILSKYNFFQKAEYIKKYKLLVDEIVFSLISNQSGHINKDEYQELFPDAVEVDFNWKPCRQLWDRMIITYDGRLVACCIDFEAELEYANLKDESLKSAWNNLKMQKFRQEQLGHKFENMNLCKECDSPYIQKLSVFEQINEKQ